MNNAFFRFARTRFALLAALAAGAANVFSFAPFHWWPIQFAALALLFGLICAQDSIRRSMLVGWAFSFAWLASGFHWLYISMHRYGGLPSWMAVLAVALLAAALALHVALAMGAGAWFMRRPGISRGATMLAILPVCWMLGEWLRGWVLTGFPWIASGYAHTVSPLAGFAPIVGVYGIGWLAALIGGCIALLPEKKSAALLALGILAGGSLLKTVSWTSPQGELITVRLLQGNIPQEMKFAPEQIHETLALYDSLIQAAPADLIASPETALPLLSHQLPPDYLPRIAGFAERTGSHIALGLAMSDGPRRYANSLIGLRPASDKSSTAGATGPQLYRYDKHHLVPFGEFIPAGARWFVEMMKIPLGDFTRGSVLQQPFQVNDQWVLPNICYEDLFGEEIANQLAAAFFSDAPQASVLLNISNIAWFGDSVALPQHLQISQMRSQETRRPMLRATNTGMTAIVNPDGSVAAALPPFSRAALSGSVQGYAGWTPYMLFGNTPMVVVAALVLFAVWLASRRNRKGAAANTPFV